MDLRADLSEANIIFIHSALDDAGLSAPAFRVFAHLARRAGKDGCYPSAESMMRICRLERKTIFTALAELEQQGLITRTKRPGSSTKYTLNAPSRWSAKRVNPESPPGGQTGQGVVGQTGLGVVGQTGHEGYPLKEIQEGNPEGTPEPPAVSPKSRNVPRNIKMIRPEMGEVIEFVKSLGLRASDAEFCYYKWTGNDWTNGKAPIRDWKATIRSWKAASYLPSQKASGAARQVESHTPAEKKIKRDPERLVELLELVRIRFPDAIPVPWHELPQDIRAHAERQLSQQSNPQPQLI